MSPNFFKFLAVTLTTSFVFCGLSVYALKQAVEQNPDAVISINDSRFHVRDIALNLNGNNLKLELSDSRTPYENEVSEIKEKVTSLNVKGVSADWKIQGTDQATLKIEAHGQLDKSKAASLIQIERNAENLEVASHKNEKGVHNLSVTIHVPKAWLKNLEIKTVSGDAEVSSLSLDELSFKTVSGDLDSESTKARKISLNAVSADIELKKMDIQELKGESISGDLKIEDTTAFSGSWSSLSGDVQIKYFKDPQTEFKLKTVSGSVENRFGSPAKAQTNLAITITSGDIEIQ